MTSKTINLTEPVKGHHGVIKTIMLREPKYSDFIDTGVSMSPSSVLPR
jgi:hypothetical protein